VTGTGRSAPRGRVGGSLLALFLLAACGGPAPLPPVGTVIVSAAELAPALQEAGLDSRALQSAARDGLGGGGLQVDDGARRSFRARVGVVAFGVLPSRGGPVTAEVVVDLRVEPTWAAGPGAQASGRGTAPFQGGDGREAWRQATREAIAEAARSVAADLFAQRKGTDELIRELSDASPAVRVRAVRTLAARGAREAASAIAGRIHDPDPQVVGATIDALVAFKDPSTVLSLIDAAQSGSAATTIRLISVLDEIGGPDVEGYLLTLQSGHENRAVRQAAAEALGGSRHAPVKPTAKR
jgi:hypothetical protein